MYRLNWTADFSFETIQVRKLWSNFFKVIKEKRNIFQIQRPNQDILSHAKAETDLTNADVGSWSNPAGLYYRKASLPCQTPSSQLQNSLGWVRERNVEISPSGRKTMPDTTLKPHKIQETAEMVSAWVRITIFYHII